MKLKFLIVLPILIISFIFISPEIFAQEPSALENLNFPVEELGGCKDQLDCAAFCDKPENGEACLNFAQKNDLMSDQEVKIAKRFLSGEADGPGGCQTKDACEEYCNNIEHIDECISFAEENNLIPPEELEEAKRVQAAIKRGVMPPPCGNKRACDIYCEDPEHMEECIAFGLEAGFIRGKEAEDAQKMLQAVKRGVKPPPCKGKKACDEYCSNPDNMETCMNFAIEAGFMSEQEKADSQKMLQALKKGIKPPPCKGKEECDAYCMSEEHFNECADFAVAAGFMSEKDAEMARKTGGKGPGGCRGKEECEAFCNNPDNQETCFNFAKDNGMISEEDLKQMEEGKQRMKESLEQAPAEVITCLQTELGADMVEKMKNGVMPPRDIGDKMQGCFQQMGPPPGEGGENFQPGPGMINPGGQMMPQQAGPGGCKTPEECQQYCQENPDNCENFQEPPMTSGPCEGENCQQYGPPPSSGGQPCEGENCPQYGPMPQGQPCQGDNCQQFGPAQPCEGESCQQYMPPVPTGEQSVDQQFQPSTEPGAGGNLQPGTFVPSAPPENPPAPPPPPPPPSSFFKIDSFLGSVLYTIAKGIYSFQVSSLK